MKKTTILLIAILSMVIGYAAYNATINIYGNALLAENISDFKVYLSNLKVNGTEVSGINDTKDEFTISDINGDISVDIVNDSTEYDTEAYLECDVDNTWNFDYTGGEQTFTAPITDTYKLEVWGASGGDANSSCIGGYGGYSVGNIKMSSNQKIYINVGEIGKTSVYSNTTYPNNPSYNGGGAGFAGGGGATHISASSGILSTFETNKSSIFIVAGGGGGARSYSETTSNYSGNGGSGGGYIGGDGIPKNSVVYGYGTGGTQSSGGYYKYVTSSNGATYGSFGQGAVIFTPYGSVYLIGSGGGGGLYGGGSVEHGPAGGGSGYIGNSLLSEKTMYCYNCTESSETSTKTISTTCVNSNPTANCAKSGNGYARVTLTSSSTNITTDKVTITAQENSNQNIKNIVGKSITCKLKVNKISRTEKKVYNGPTEWTFDYTGGEQTFTAPIAGTYKLEVWGAQGGSANETYLGGSGGYSIGRISLNKRQEIYVNIGGSGSIDNDYNETTFVDGGYNGGGTACGYKDKFASSGGGATHIATLSGVLSSLENQKDNILIVAGGGGGAGFQPSGGAGNGGSGGGFKGESGTTTGNYQNLFILNGGSQSSGGSFVQYGDYTYYESSFGSGGGATKSKGNASGGGGGLYGGGLGNLFMGAGGGSGYIGNSLLTEKTMYCYNCEESSEENTKTISTTCTSATPTANCAKQGNGYARITLVSID